MKELKLRTGQCAEVDDHNIERLLKFRWRAHPKSGNIQRDDYSGLKHKCVSLASEVMNNPGFRYDHIDRNPFNNLESNLRRATRAQNEINKPKQPGTSSKYKGVCWLKTNKKWLAKIKINGKQINLGSFHKETDAAIAYNKAVIQAFNDFAVLNRDETGEILWK